VAKILPAMVLCLLAALAVHAEEPAASEASIRELFAVMETEKMVDRMYGQLDAMMQASMQQAIAGHPVTPEQQKIIDETRTKLVALYKEDMTWSSLEPTVIAIYRKSFTEAEVKGMIGFYRSPAGKAVVAKMPVVLQATMEAAHTRMTTLMPKLQQLQQDTTARLKAASQN
jgi:hypothetical protein